jgi:hypothetical protein
VVITPIAVKVLVMEPTRKTSIGVADSIVLDREDLGVEVGNDPSVLDRETPSQVEPGERQSPTPGILGSGCYWGAYIVARVSGLSAALMLRGLSPIPAVYRGFPLYPDDDDDPYVFRIYLSEFGIGRAVSSSAKNLVKGTTALHIDFFPPSLQKRPATTNPRRWVTGVLGALAVATTATAVRRLSRQ